MTVQTRLLAKTAQVGYAYSICNDFKELSAIFCLNKGQQNTQYEPKKN